MSITSNTETTSPVAAPNPSTKINPEQAVAFAALILADDNLAITPEKLQALLKAAGITDVEPIWTSLFANALKDKDVKDVLTTVATFSPEAGGDVAPPCRHRDEEDTDGSESSDEEITCTFFDTNDIMGTMGLFG